MRNFCIYIHKNYWCVVFFFLYLSLVLISVLIDGILFLKYEKPYENSASGKDWKLEHINTLPHPEFTGIKLMCMCVCVILEVSDLWMKTDYLRTHDLKLIQSSSDSWFSDFQPNEPHRLRKTASMGWECEEIRTLVYY